MIVSALFLGFRGKQFGDQRFCVLFTNFVLSPVEYFKWCEIERNFQRKLVVLCVCVDIVVVVVVASTEIYIDIYCEDNFFITDNLSLLCIRRHV